MEPAAIHLDTSFLIRSLAPGSAPDRSLRRWLGAGHRLAMSTIAWTEFLCGPLDPSLLTTTTRLVTERIPFDERDAATAADLFNATGRRRGTLIDCMIAAAALRRDAPLATANPDDFRRFEPAGLRLAG